uniref:UDP-N-acetylglucosamine 2-epimerase n=1 Tax=Campylobacter concisus TaxID=199 RepID=UPI000CD8B854
MRKICVVTSTRAEYGLLYWLLKEIKADSELELQIIVTGMHLSPEFGLTYKEIEKEFKIDKKIEILGYSHSKLDICTEMAKVYEKFAPAFSELKPDILVLLGDRYEIFGVAGVASIMQIPIAHIHGGETTQGAFDEAFRHSITKMSHIHFAATREYANRIIQLGEEPSRDFNVGGTGIE